MGGQLILEVKLYLNAGLTWLLGAVVWIETTDMVLKIIAGLAALVTTVVAIKKYIDSKEAHKIKMKSEQLLSEIRQQELYQLMKKNLEHQENEKKS